MKFLKREADIRESYCLTEGQQEEEEEKKIVWCQTQGICGISQSQMRNKRKVAQIDGTCLIKEDNK